jgi:hypothetical protein
MPHHEDSCSCLSGDFIYRTKAGADLATTLTAAKRALQENGGSKNFGTDSIFIVISGRGEYSFNEDTSIEEITAQDRKYETRQRLKTALTGLNQDQMLRVIDFISTLKSEQH